jgi:hypothetical protein
MGRASIFWLATFRTACSAALIFWVITFAFGCAAYLTPEDRLRSDLLHQIFDEELQLHESALDDGSDAVQRAIEHLIYPNRTRLHVVAPVGQSCSTFAGSIANGLNLSLANAVAKRHGATITEERNNQGLQVCASFEKPWIPA